MKMGTPKEAPLILGIPHIYIYIYVYVGYCPQKQSTLGFLIRAIYSHIIFIIHLLLRGGSTQYIYIYIYMHICIVLPTLGPKIYKSYLHWPNWIPRAKSLPMLCSQIVPTLQRHCLSTGSISCSIFLSNSFAIFAK